MNNYAARMLFDTGVFLARGRVISVNDINGKKTTENDSLKTVSQIQCLPASGGCLCNL